jgi:hypothetical protein
MVDGDVVNEELVEVFRCTSLATAQMAIDVVLSPAGIPADIRNRTSTILPAPASMMGDYYLAVPRGRAAEAIDLLRGAQEGGALSDQGDVEV